ncbi:E3 ubiquitin-protein ligase RNF34 isoform X1 [Vanessa atalanta]|uniref:E3 ubiquitin-protein ligase RNF34 isoform X1 n=1 Tax=Vanessa atalanta TaxID=42275 RepID=UPI001FCDD09F|nr:E3 ubiquitin-protein ligase RNF34 isoform X1 [Vanessa atalanta]
MILRGRECYKMPCESCAVQFSVFKRKRACSECERNYCSGCLRRGGGTMCGPCRVLSTRPLYRQSISHLKVRDLQYFLQRQNVSTRGCVEKEELVSLCVSHVNSAAYRRRGPRAGASPFSSLKGLTTNINDFINSAFDLRNPAHPAPPADRSSCFNSSHAHSPTNGTAADANIPDRRFTPTPGGERDVRVSASETEPAAERGAEADAEREPEVPVDTTDCFEIEDLDDTGWEFITRPAAPLPNDSEVLLAALRGSPRRAASELELHTPDGSAASAGSASLQDEPQLRDPADPAGPDAPDLGNHSPKHLTLEQIKQATDLDLLSVKQLKELLTRNRVEFRGCLERKDLLERAKTLWANHVKYKDEIDNLPFEESCKICMAAPLECVLLECGHIAACTACSKQLAECPICRQYVVRAVRFFRS